MSLSPRWIQLGALSHVLPRIVVSQRGEGERMNGRNAQYLILSIVLVVAPYLWAAGLEGDVAEVIP